MEASLIETARAFAALALIALALAAAFGRHEVVLRHLGHSSYALIALIVRLATLGRVQLPPLARRMRNRQLRRLRALQDRRTAARRPAAEGPVGGWTALSERAHVLDQLIGSEDNLSFTADPGAAPAPPAPAPSAPVPPAPPPPQPPVAPPSAAAPPARPFLLDDGLDDEPPGL